MPANRTQHSYDHEGSLVEAINVNGYPHHQFAHWKPFPHHTGWPLQVIGAGDDLWCRGCLRRRHNARLLAIELVTEGEFLFAQDGREHVVPAGHLFLVRPGCTSTMKLNSGEFGRKSVLQITGPLLPSLINLTRLNEVDTFRVANVDWLLEQHRNAYETLLDCRPGFMQVVSPIAYNVVVELGQMAARNNVPITVRQAINLMEHRVHTTITVEDLSKATHVSQATINRLFTQHFSKSPINYFIDMKIELAKSSFANTQATVKRVAADLGYDNQQYFSTLFHRRVGMTPRAYRQSILKSIVTAG